MNFKRLYKEANEYLSEIYAKCEFYKNRSIYEKEFKSYLIKNGGLDPKSSIVITPSHILVDTYKLWDIENACICPVPKILSDIARQRRMNAINRDGAKVTKAIKKHTNILECTKAELLAIDDELAAVDEKFEALKKQEKAKLTRKKNELTRKYIEAEINLDAAKEQDLELDRKIAECE